METLRLRVEYKPMEPSDEPAPTGFVHVERDEQRAFLLTPDEIDASKRYPLITVLHGAGRQDEILAKAYRDEPEARQVLFLSPRSAAPTWDLIVGGPRRDLDFLEYAYDLIYRRYPVDRERQALLGYSDGASYGLSVGMSNPSIFRALMGWAAGFVAVDPDQLAPEPRPDLDFLDYAYDLIYRRYPVDRARQGLLGYSDGASYALSVGMSNPSIFRALLGWAAGFVAVEPDVPTREPRPDILLEYGTHDQLFPFEQIALPMRKNLESVGYQVEFRVDEGGRHWPPSDFQPEALDWFFKLPRR